MKFSENWLREHIQTTADRDALAAALTAIGLEVEELTPLGEGLDKVVALGYPVLFGISRKRVVDYLLGGNTQAKDRDQGTAALSGYAVSKGCQIVRVHNVDANRDIVKTILGIL